MTSALEELRQVSPPPERPFGVNGDWSRIEKDLGLRLPPDFKEYASVYGQGRFGRDEILVFHPLEWLDVRETWSQRAAHYKAWLEAGFNVPYPIFPEFEGLLPCAMIGDVNRINWITRGSPGNWPLVYFDRDYGYFEDELKGLTFVEFLVEIITGRSELMKVVNGEFRSPPEFEPWPG